MIAGITSNLKRKGILLSKNEGAMKDSVIKLYIFTIYNEMVSKVILHLSKEKKRLIWRNLARDLMDSKHNLMFIFFR